jgi:GAF domain-containing protein
MASAVQHLGTETSSPASRGGDATSSVIRGTTTRNGHRPLALHRLTRPIVTAGNVHDCLVALADGMVRLLDVDHVAATIDAGDHGQVHVVANDATADRVVALQRAVDEGPHVAAGRLGEVVTCPDLALEERWPGLVEVLTRLELRTAAAFPLAFYGRRLGSVSIYDEQPRVLEARELDIARLLTGAAAAAISYPHPPSAPTPDAAPVRDADTAPPTT